MNNEEAGIMKDFILNKEKYMEEGKKVMEIWDNECNKDNILKCRKKMQNERIDCFEKFKSWAIIEYFIGIKNNINKNNLFSEEMNRMWYSIKNDNLSTFEKFQMLNSNIISEFTTLINDGKIFKINEEIKDLLSNTDIKVKYEKDIMPFRQILIDVGEIEQKNNSWFGILVEKISIKKFKIDGISKEKDEALKILLVGRDNNDTEAIYLYDFLCDEGMGDSHTKDKEEEIFNNNYEREEFTKKMFKIVLNFLNFINHPEVELIENSRAILRKNKNEKNLLGKPNEIELNITGKLKKYIYENRKESEKAWEIGHRFWVRGHWMEFKNERYKNMKGKKKWILPYIKGKGELINKKYYVGEKEQCWENEKRMIKLIINLFPDKNILNHNRTILNGLEIDCYIPDLKIGFEYNGEQHYSFPNAFHKTEEQFKKQLERDKEKMKIATEKNIKLITIKYDEKLSEELIKSKIKNE